MNPFQIACEMFKDYARGTNPEYERAVIEFLGAATGVPSDEWETLEEMVWNTFA